MSDEKVFFICLAVVACGIFGGMAFGGWSSNQVKIEELRLERAKLETAR